MRSSRFPFAEALGLLACACACPLWGQSLQGIGDGSPNDGIRMGFQTAFTRGRFSNLAALPPLANVRKMGPTGLAQEFADVTLGTSRKHALVLPNTAGTGTAGEIWQVHGPLYEFWTSLSVATAGYPAEDTQACPPVIAGCLYQTFDKNYILFSLTGQGAGADYFIEGNFFTKWTGSGGMNTFGPAISQVTTVASGAKTGTAALRQRFSRGEIFEWTSGTNLGRVYGVYEPVYTYYFETNGGSTGLLGLPTSDVTVLSDGRRRQSFEGGVIEYVTGQEPTILYPVAAVILSAASNTLNLKLGDTVDLTASTYSAIGQELTGRNVSWITSNSRVVSIESNGARARLRAVGGGSAVVTAVSEGKASRALPVFVSAPCCQPGEGAPSEAVAQAFTDAITRARLLVKLPTASPVRRDGLGYTQEFTSTDGMVRYVLAKPDTMASAFVLTGPVLAKYAELGGPSGALGYPVADLVGGARQAFQNGVLAGFPVQLVVDPVLARWASLQYETGVAGAPVGATQTVLSFTATAAIEQPFGNGVFSYAVSGERANQVFLVKTQILAAYRSHGGATGKLGLPLGDESSASGARRQEFEGGSLLLDAVGAVQVIDRARTPRITAAPANVAAGSRVRLAAGGFPAGATLRISVSGRPDFLVQTLSGAYAWEMVIPASTPSSLVTLRAVEVNGAAIAAGSFVVQASSETLVKLSKLRGDFQTGLPGARLPLPFRVSLKDEFGAVLAGVPVRFTASPGAKVELAGTVTNAQGEAQAYLRMPFAESVALATAEAGGAVVTFSARAVASSFTNFPNYTQSGNGSALGPGPSTVASQGALLVSAANLVRYLQNSGELPSPHGAADPVLLNSFMKDLCQFDASGAQVCDGFLAQEGAAPALNLWRLGMFTGSPIRITPVQPSTSAVRDTLASGRPVLLVMNLTVSGVPAGAHFVTAMGVNRTGGILVRDPNPNLARPTLEDYVSGFLSEAGPAKAVLAAALRMEPDAAATPGFLVSGAAVDFDLTSVRGRCGETLSWGAWSFSGSELPASAPAALSFRHCDGLESNYQLDATADGERALTLTDLGLPAGRQGVGVSGAASYRVTRAAEGWRAGPLSVQFSAASVVNAASFRPELSPGSLATIFGAGLKGAAGATEVEVAGQPAEVLASFPFQVNFVIPRGLAPGSHPITIRSPYGSLTQTIAVHAVSPAVFLLGGGQPAVVNQDGSINSTSTPATRGEAITVYATGFGEVERRGNLDYVVANVTATVAGRPLGVQFAGLAPGYSGLYQLNLIIPVDAPPGLAQELSLNVGEGGTVAGSIAVQ
ncbi:MAG: hypothetical protein IT164_03070 [Bryobacterales bacterium]|nr:hypothetical protein [Bryobacterales bacterium]